MPLKKPFFSFQVVTEYERAVIFRLGRLRKGGSKGPGIFTVIPCIDTYRCVDLRTVSFDVPPQEVKLRVDSKCLWNQKMSHSKSKVLRQKIGRTSSERAIVTLVVFATTPRNIIRILLLIWKKPTYFRNSFAKWFTSFSKILSRDSVTVSVDAVVYFNVIDAEQALCSVDDFRWFEILLVKRLRTNLLQSLFLNSNAFHFIAFCYLIISWDRE